MKETLIEFESVALGAANKHNKVIEAGKLYLIYPAKTLENTTEEKVFTVISPTTGKQEISVTGTYFTIPNVNLDTAPSADNIEEPYKTLYIWCYFIALSWYLCEPYRCYYSCKLIRIE